VNSSGSHRVVPSQSFETNTRPIMVSAWNDRLFAALAWVLSRPEWGHALAINAARVADKADLLAKIERVFLTWSKGCS
jgi:crotonobetainyl-CoA:carnitine CoA-transferase CaiB-like acyl-CoA transferase